MARPKGQFAYMMERLWNEVLLLAKPTCWASNAYFAEKLGRSERQISRYFEALEKLGRMDVLLKRFYYEQNKLKTMRLVSVKTKESGFGKPMPATAAVPGMKVDTSKRFPKLRRGSSEVPVSREVRSPRLPDAGAAAFKPKDAGTTAPARASSWKGWAKPTHEAMEFAMKTILVDGMEREVPRDPDAVAQEERSKALTKSREQKLKEVMEALRKEDEENAKHDAYLAANPRERIRFYDALDRKVEKVRNIVITPREVYSSGDE